MGAHTQALLNECATLAAYLCGEARVHSYYLMPSTCSLGFKDIEKCTPTGVQNGFGKMMVFHQVVDGKFLDSDMMIAFAVLFGNLEMEVPPLTGNLEMGLSSTSGGLTPSFASFLPTAQHTLLASECLLALAIIV